jgi:SAM-dependent methyltransferase
MAWARCPVCRARATRPFAAVAGRRYGRCRACAATFLDPLQLPARADEHAHYRTHRNDAAEPGYRAFAARLARPLLARVGGRATVLDFGCGPSSALAALLEEAGCRVARFDPLFWPDPAPLASTFDAVAAMEVIEHLHRPADAIDRLARRVRPGGWLGLMTCVQTDDARFARWWYRRDPTHVVFYRARTLHVLAARLGWRCELPAKDVALMKRPARP